MKYIQIEKVILTSFSILFHNIAIFT